MEVLRFQVQVQNQPLQDSICVQLWPICCYLSKKDPVEKLTGSKSSMGPDFISQLSQLNCFIGPVGRAKYFHLVLLFF